VQPPLCSGVATQTDRVAQTLTQPGYFYDFESDGWLVLSLLTPEADFASGVTAIERQFTA
jgi:hypothetical protein